MVRDLLDHNLLDTWKFKNQTTSKINQKLTKISCIVVYI